MGVGANLSAGNDARAVAESEAQQFETRGRQSFALGSRQAERIARSVERVKARQLAVLAASGFSPTDDTGQALQDAVTREGAVQSMLAAAQAEDEYRQDMWRAGLRRRAGAQAQAASRLQAASTLISGVFDWRQRFGRVDNAGKPVSSGADAQVDRGGATPPPFVDDWATAGGY